MTRLIFTGTLTDAAHKQHVPVAFAVPPGVTRITGRFAATPERAAGALFDNLISLSIFAPDGSRGARHNNPDRGFALDAHQAAPGFTPGPMTPGVWTVVMDCFRIIGPDPVQWTLEVVLSTEPVAAPPPVPPRVTPHRGPGWYLGDLHAHTFHSDSSWDLPGLVGFARRNNLDFVTLTDHNTVAGRAAFEQLSDETLLTMGGIELTTHYGHALALGATRWQEWRASSMPGVTMPGIAREVERNGHLFVMAHPRSPGDPSCTGCRWEFAEMMPGAARTIEIWNGPWSDYNEEGLALYRQWLSEGHRLVATAGSDTHGPGPKNERNGFNRVHAAALTEAAILEAVRAGRNVLTSGPALTFALSAADGSSAEVGGTLRGFPGEARITLADGEGLTLRIVAAGGALVEQRIADGSHALPLPRTDSPWLMAELRNADDVLHAVSNPIFVVG